MAFGRISYCFFGFGSFLKQSAFLKSSPSMPSCLIFNGLETKAKEKLTFSLRQCYCPLFSTLMHSLSIPMIEWLWDAIKKKSIKIHAMSINTLISVATPQIKHMNMLAGFILCLNYSCIGLGCANMIIDNAPWSINATQDVISWQSNSLSLWSFTGHSIFPENMAKTCYLLFLPWNLT